MRRYFGLCLLVLIGIIQIQAQTTSGESSILYVGWEIVDDEETRFVYIRDIESDAEPLAIGHVNQFGSDVAWSPDGRYVTIINYDENGNRLLTLYDVEAQSSELLSDALLDDDCSTPVFFSGSDDFIAYAYLDGDEAFMAVRDLSDGTVTIAGEIDRNRGYYYPLWSLGGRFLIVPLPETDDILLWDAHHNQGEVLAILEDQYRQSVWSSDDRFLMFSGNRNEDATLYIYDTMTGETIETSGDTIGQFSPDNRYAVYVDRNFSEASHTIYIRDLINNTETLVTDNSITFYNMSFSGDSAYLAYTARSEESTQEISGSSLPILQSLQLYEIETGNTSTAIASLPYIRRIIPSPSSDDMVIIYMPQDYTEGTGRGVIYHPQTEISTELDIVIPGLYYLQGAYWTPDGEYVTIMVEDERRFLVYDAANAEILQIPVQVEVVEGLMQPVWSANGRYMMFAASEHGTSNNLFLLDVDTRETQYLMSREDYGVFIGWRGTDDNNSLIYCGEG